MSVTVVLSVEEAQLLADCARAVANRSARDRDPFAAGLPALRYVDPHDVAPVDELHRLAERLDVLLIRSG